MVNPNPSTVTVACACGQTVHLERRPGRQLNVFPLRTWLLTLNEGWRCPACIRSRTLHPGGRR